MAGVEGTVMTVRARPLVLALLLMIIGELSEAQTPGFEAPATLVYHSFDAQQSTIHVVTRRSGLLSFLGHDHAILAREWHGQLCAATPFDGRGRARISVVSDSLEIDSDSARALAGLGRGPSSDQRRKLQVTMLDQDHIDAAGHPEIVLEITNPVGAADAALSVSGQLTIRGVTEAVSVPLRIVAIPGALRFVGVARVAQRSFGIRPESIGGVVRVADTVEIHFDLVAEPTLERCVI
jgi:hypothetical protein